MSVISRRRTAGAAGTLLVMIVLAAGLGQAPAQAGGRDRSAMLSLTNASRASHKRAVLKLDVALSVKAKRHSEAMAKAGSLFHSSNVPGELGRKWSAWGENVGYTSESLNVLQNAFMHSPEHRGNILNRKFTYVGIGVVHSGGYTWVTVIFYG